MDGTPEPPEPPEPGYSVTHEIDEAQVEAKKRLARRIAGIDGDGEAEVGNRASPASSTERREGDGL